MGYQFDDVTLVVIAKNINKVEYLFHKSVWKLTSTSHGLDLSVSKTEAVAIAYNKKRSCVTFTVDDDKI